MKEEKTLQFYDVKVEAIIPCNLVYKVMASSPEEALNQIDKKHPNSCNPIIIRKRLTKAKVFTSGSLIIQFSKEYK